MAAGDVEVLRGAQRGAQAGDEEAFFKILDPRVEWDSTQFGDLTGVAGLVHGTDEVRRWFADWVSIWKGWTFEIEEVTDFGEEILVLVLQYGRGRGSGAEVTREHAEVWKFKNGLAVRVRLFPTRPAAVDALGP